MSFINFESAKDKEQARKELKEAREQMLEKAKQDAERRAERQTQKLLSGETNWMLPAVASKFDQADLKKVKKSHKYKKSKKFKKSSQKKRKRKYSTSSSSEDSVSETDESSEEERRHKSKKTKKSKKKRKEKPSKKQSSSESSNDEYTSKKASAETWIEKPVSDPPLKRENWMMDASEFSMKTFMRDRNEQKRTEAKPAETYDPAKSSRELNPHWKTTGTGLPAFQKPREYSDDEQTTIQVQKTSENSGWRKNTALQKIQKLEISKKNRSSSSSSESASEIEEESKPTQSTAHESTSSSTEFLTDQQMNELGAKILKAEILGNLELVESLQRKLEKAREQRNAIKERKSQILEKPAQVLNKKKHEEHIILTRTDKEGNFCPLESSFNKGSVDHKDLYGGRSNRKKSGKRTETHVDGERVRYFPDDDKYDIKQMFEREKYTTSAEANLEFANIASKHENPNDDLEDIFTDKISKGYHERNIGKKDIDRAINAHEKLEAQLDNCDKCFDSPKMNKSLIVCMGEKVYLTLPWHSGLQAGHCLIVPTQHVSSSTQLDEDTWEEVQNFRKSLTQMFAAQRKDVIFFEIANKLHRRPHLTIHCIPIPMSQGESAPFYFKKAIEESEHEWSINKQLVRLNQKKGLRNCIPKGLPYFWVQFGVESGFAHVIEDQDRFPSNFALEIIGGMLHLEASKWRKPQKEQNYIAKVKMFADWWKKFDCTQ